MSIIDYYTEIVISNLQCSKQKLVLSQNETMRKNKKK